MKTYIIYYQDMGNKEAKLCEGLDELISTLSTLNKSQWVEKDTIKIIEV